MIRDQDSILDHLQPSKLLDISTHTQISRATLVNAILDCMEPKLAWLAFKHTLFSLIKRHIPYISVKSDFTSPWFDSDCFEAYRKKKDHIRNLKVSLT